MMVEVADKFYYVYSCDLDVNIQIKIGTLEGLRERPSYKDLIDDPMLRFSGAYQETCSDLYVTCQVFADGKPLTLPVRTAYKAFSTRWNWNEWLTLPVKYSDLPRNAHLSLTVWDIYGSRQSIPVGGTTVSLFGKRGTFRQGMHDLKVWADIEADGRVSTTTTTPGKTPGKEDQMSRLSKLSKKHRNGHMAKVDWLDRLTFREIEMINEKQKRDSNFMFLMIEFPRIHLDGTDFSVVYFERGGDEVYHVRAYADLVTVPDPEILMENLVESKHHKLARSLRSGPIDRDLKPNAHTRDQLNVIVGYPPTKTLTSEEQDLIWKFRFYLSTQKKALTKFLKSVSWTVPQEEKQAVELLRMWAPMDVEDALELLSPAFKHTTVRRYAVTRLRQADDEELLMYLLQLVQALKYENFEEISIAYEEEKERINQPAIIPVSPGGQGRRGSSSSLPGSSSDSSTLTNSLSDRERSQTMRDSREGPEMGLQAHESLLDALGVADNDNTFTRDPNTETEMDLASFLIDRTCNNSTLANYFCWYLYVECDEQESQTKDPSVSNMYVTVLKRFSQALNNGGHECRLRRAAIAGQQVFMDKMVKLVKMVARESGNRKKKIEKLQALLVDPEILKFNFTNFEPIPLPLDPEVSIKAIVSESATLLKALYEHWATALFSVTVDILRTPGTRLIKSALMPCRFTFKTVDDQEYVSMFKHGDDLRQDQLIIQIITLMDKLLRKENLDLKLTPYKVLATSSKQGFVQFVESTAVAEVLEKEGSILNFFRKHAYVENAPYNVAPEVIDTYVKTCAGYCVITYLLGVGDRHLDNLLLTKTGKLFHVDFGYILGRDPKPMPPPMKLSKEMVDAMGGTNSEHYTDFKKLCYTAFLHLRRSANLILNLFSLMVDANVPDIALEPDKTVKKVQDKFRLDLTDEEAVHYMQSLIDASVSATVAALLEQMHKFAQYWRK